MKSTISKKSVSLFVFVIPGLTRNPGPKRLDSRWSLPRTEFTTHHDAGMRGGNDKICKFIFRNGTMYHPHNKKRTGFTSVELLVALMVCAIVFTAVASLAYALGSASSSTEELSARQMTLRCATVRITDLIKRSVMAFATSDDGSIVLWTGDQNDDGLINGSEVVYIGTDAGSQSLLLLYFPGQNQVVTISGIEAGTAKTDLINDTAERTMILVPDCSNVQFSLGVGSYVNILFDLTENGITSTYQISSVLRCSADHLLDPATGELHGLGDDD